MERGKISMHTRVQPDIRQAPFMLNRLGVWVDALCPALSWKGSPVFETFAALSPLGVYKDVRNTFVPIEHSLAIYLTSWNDRVSLFQLPIVQNTFGAHFGDSPAKNDQARPF
eukprot:1336873-Amphidinium_carterae.1